MTQTQHILAVINDIAILFPAFIIIFTWRGFIQALVAKRVGDDTAQRYGFLTLNPLAHINMNGMLMLIFIYFFVGGLLYNVLPRAVLLIILIMLGVRWTIPVPVDERMFKNLRIGGTAQALSGPLGNFLLAFLTVPLFRLVMWKGFPPYVILSFAEIFRTIIDIALFFGVIDLMPIPPFDGGRILRYALPQSAQHIVRWMEEHALFIFLALFFLPGVSDVFFGGIITAVALIKKSMFYLFF